MLAEYHFRAALQHVQFKYVAWLFEILLCCIVAIILLWAQLHPHWNLAIVVICTLRVITAALNHDHVARLHNIHDPWRIMYPFV